MLDVKSLFLKNDIKTWEVNIPKIVGACNGDRECLLIVRVVLTRDLIPAMMSEMVSNKANRVWLELWQKYAGKYEEFSITFEILEAVVKYKESSYDRRSLFALPRELRVLVTPLLPKPKN